MDRVVPDISYQMKMQAVVQMVDGCVGQRHLFFSFAVLNLLGRSLSWATVFIFAAGLTSRAKQTTVFRPMEKTSVLSRYGLSIIKVSSLQGPIICLSSLLRGLA